MLRVRNGRSVDSRATWPSTRTLPSASSARPRPTWKADLPRTFRISDPAAIHEAREDARPLSPPSKRDSFFRADRKRSCVDERIDAISSHQIQAQLDSSGSPRLSLSALSRDFAPSGVGAGGGAYSQNQKLRPACQAVTSRSAFALSKLYALATSAESAAWLVTLAASASVSLPHLARMSLARILVLSISNPLIIYLVNSSRFTLQVYETKMSKLSPTFSFTMHYFANPLKVGG